MAWGLVLTGDSCRVGPLCEPCGLSMVETPSNFVRVCGVGAGVECVRTIGRDFQEFSFHVRKRCICFQLIAVAGSESRGALARYPTQSRGFPFLHAAWNRIESCRSPDVRVESSLLMFLTPEQARW